MEDEQTEIKGLTESRFEFIIFFFRAAGIPFHMKKISTTFAIYMITVIFCACITFLGILADVYVNRDDFGHAMTSIRMLIPLTDITWLYLYCR